MTWIRMLALGGLIILTLPAYAARQGVVGSILRNAVAQLGRPKRAAVGRTR